MKVLSVVCARKGSKGLKNKCVSSIDGRMAASYAIDYSLSLGDVVKTVVSTDIDELIDYCRLKGVAFICREKKLCSDKMRIDDVLADAIERAGDDYEYCSLVYGNIPTRYKGLFNEALDFLEEHLDYEAVISMQNVEKFHPDWMFEYDERILPKIKETQYRRQSLPQRMIHDGHTLLFRSQPFYRRFKGLESYDRRYRYAIYGRKIKPLVNSELIIDIDAEKDLKLARLVLTKCEKKGGC